ncbi:MAG: hypothetical protein JWO35_433 [Candidatus Saccharibacteria bacterium]|nr:hypothetical protein [Candidatus Saccharibacteria bacterium]
MLSESGEIIRAADQRVAEGHIAFEESLSRTAEVNEPGVLTGHIAFNADRVEVAEVAVRTAMGLSANTQRAMRSVREARKLLEK